jgi:hypothetical protein
MAFYWYRIEPSPGALDFAATDALVVAAAARGIAVLPVVHGTPGWAARTPSSIASPPRSPEDYGRFLRALVARYGPAGSLWAERPDLRHLPIRDWQLWNEPSITRYWTDQPFAKHYVRLVRAGRAALRAADPGACAILAGLPNESWKALRSIYRAGGRGSFDAVALHPYTSKPRNVMRIVDYARRVMRRAGDARRPLWITELSWPAGAGRIPGRPGFFLVTERQQAARLRIGVELMRRARRKARIERVLWYTWLSADQGSNDAFAYSGLRRRRGDTIVSAPSLRAFAGVARRLQGCAKAAADARRCR